MSLTLQGSARGAGRRVVILASRFNDEIVGGLVTGAREVLSAAGVAAGDVTVVWVPGALELPLAAARVAAGGKCDGIVALGCVIRGETAHFEHVGRESIRGLMEVSRAMGVPVGLGILTVENAAQARIRAGLDPDPGTGKEGGERHRGREAALACLEMIDLLAGLEAGV